MNKKWDNLDEWKSGAGMSKPGIGQREIEWPSLGGTQPFGGANPTCKACGGRLRGAKKCTCDEPEWVVAGEPVGDGADAALNISLDNIHTQQAWHLNWLVEAFRVLKPGGVLKAFGGTRTYHRLAAAMEQAGFVEIHMDAWIYGSGFPKSLNISKALDKKIGVEPQVIGTTTGKGGDNVNNQSRPGKGDSLSAKGCGAYGAGVKQVNIQIPLTLPTSDIAKKFEGYGTALKPAWEIIVVGRKPE